MYKIITLSVFLLCTTLLTAQVGIGTTNPAAGAMLDINSDNSGIVIPRVALTATNLQAPITAPSPEIGLMVFNTATAGTAPNNVTPGFYFWNGSGWVRLASGASTDWALTGNAGTTPGTAAGENFIGTSDAQALIIATNGNERMRILDNGQISINEDTPIAIDRFTVQGESGEYAINGYTSNGGAIYGLNNGGSGWGVLGESTDVGVEGYGTIGVIGESPLAGAFGILALNSNLSGSALLAIGNNGPGTYLTGGTGIASNGNSGIFGYGRNVNGTGIIAAGNNNPIIASLTTGSGVAGTGTRFGVFGIATNTTGDNYGGIFYTSREGIADATYVGGWNADTKQKVIGTGAVSTIVKDTENNPVVMFAPEAPEIILQDYGVGQLVNGKAKINLDPIIVKNIRVDNQHPLKVFVQLEGDCNGVYVTNKTQNGFEVVELQGGKSNVSFSWKIAATRADETFVSDDGTMSISKNNVRFPPLSIKAEVEYKETVERTEQTQTIDKSSFKRRRN